MTPELRRLFEDTCGKEYVCAFDRFIEGMIQRMVVSAFKYGPVTPDIWTVKCDFWATMAIREAKCRDTHNLEYLIDIANFCAMAFCYPPAGYMFASTDSDQSPGVVAQDGSIQHGDEALVEWAKTRQALKTLGPD